MGGSLGWGSLVLTGVFVSDSLFKIGAILEDDGVGFGDCVGVDVGVGLVTGVCGLH